MLYIRGLLLAIYSFGLVFAASNENHQDLASVERLDESILHTPTKFIPQFSLVGKRYDDLPESMGNVAISDFLTNDILQTIYGVVHRSYMLGDKGESAEATILLEGMNAGDNFSAKPFRAIRGGCFQDIHAGLAVLAEHAIDDDEDGSEACSKVLYICPRGSNNTADWLTNAAFWPSQDETLPAGMTMHAGFCAKARSMIFSLNQAIKGLGDLSDIDKIIFCGHSQGGATAQILPLLKGEIFRGTDINLDKLEWGVFALSSPAVFSPQTAEYIETQYGNRIIRHHMNLDPVTIAHNITFGLFWNRMVVGHESLIPFSKSVYTGANTFMSKLEYDLRNGNISDIFSTHAALSSPQNIAHGGRSDNHGGFSFNSGQFGGGKIHLDAGLRFAKEHENSGGNIGYALSYWKKGLGFVKSRRPHHIWDGVKIASSYSYQVMAYGWQEYLDAAKSSRSGFGSRTCQLIYGLGHYTIFPIMEITTHISNGVSYFKEQVMTGYSEFVNKLVYKKDQSIGKLNEVLSRLLMENIKSAKDIDAWLKEPTKDQQEDKSTHDEIVKLPVDVMASMVTTSNWFNSLSPASVNDVNSDQELPIEVTSESDLVDELSQAEAMTSMLKGLASLGLDGINGDEGADEGNDENNAALANIIQPKVAVNDHKLSKKRTILGEIL